MERNYQTHAYTKHEHERLHARIHARIHTRARTRIQTCTHARTYTHTHTRKPWRSHSFCFGFTIDYSGVHTFLLQRIIIPTSSLCHWHCLVFSHTHTHTHTQNTFFLFLLLLFCLCDDWYNLPHSHGNWRKWMVPLLETWLNSRPHFNFLLFVQYYRYRNTEKLQCFLNPVTPACLIIPHPPNDVNHFYIINLVNNRLDSLWAKPDRKSHSK